MREEALTWDATEPAGLPWHDRRKLDGPRAGWEALSTRQHEEARESAGRERRDGSICSAGLGLHIR